MKQQLRAMQGPRSLRTARRLIQGIEAVQMLRKGQIVGAIRTNLTTVAIAYSASVLDRQSLRAIVPIRATPMFRRIRESCRILTYKEPAKSPSNEPDITFEQETVLEFHKASRVIGGMISLWILAFISNVIGQYLGSIFFPQSKTVVSVGTISAFLVTVAFFLMRQIEQRVHQRLDFGDYLAPFFGRRLHHTQRILKG